jgi:REP element-mobilizing transposase RayT
MSQSFVRLIGHIIFSTKHRERCLDAEIRPGLFAYMAGTLNDMGCHCYLVGGHIDHIHALCLMNKNLKVIKIIEDLKTSSSKWIKTKGIRFRRFHWQSGYGVFSVSSSNLNKVRRYIERQDLHHRKMTFQEEFLKFLKEYGAEYDERYLWD